MAGRGRSAGQKREQYGRPGYRKGNCGSIGSYSGADLGTKGGKKKKGGGGGIRESWVRYGPDMGPFVVFEEKVKKDARKKALREREGALPGRG